MTSSVTESDYVWKLLTSAQVVSIQTTVLIDFDSREETLPDEIYSEAVPLLKNLKGRIFPIALRGKSQAGKSTTLNRFANIAKLSIKKKLPVGKDVGRTTTQGIWLMIITFNNSDALLLFDMQGTDRGADEVTYKLIAFTDQICTRVVDVFRMPPQGFTNEYIDTLYCLSNARDSVKDLEPTSNKTILWTDCVWPKHSSYGEEQFDEPEGYHRKLLQDVHGARITQAEKATQYAGQTRVFATRKPPDEIKQEISELDDIHPFIENEIIPALKNILFDVPPFKIQSCEIKDAIDYVGYLNEIFKGIKQKHIDLPFCQSQIIKSVVLSNVVEQKIWIDEQIEQIKQCNSTDWDWIENNSQHDIENIRNQCIQQLEDSLNGVARNLWEDHLEDLKLYVKNCNEKLIDQLKCSITKKFVPKKEPELYQLCTLGYGSDVLKCELNKKKNEIIKQLSDTPIFKDKIDTEKELMEQMLNIRIDELYRMQQTIENEWSSNETEFEKILFPPDENAIDQKIDDLIETHRKFAITVYEKFEIIPKTLSDVVTKKKELKEHNKDRVKQVIDTCQGKYITLYNSYIVQTLRSTDTSVQDKYKQLIIRLQSYQQQCYEELGSLRDDPLYEKFDNQLKQKLNQALDQIFSPAVQDKLKKERRDQLEYLAKFTGHKEEALAWVHCIGCQRIFAGRTTGCKDVECDYNDTGYERGQKADYVCSLTFQWKKARPVDFSTFSNDFWLSPHERRGTPNRVQKALNQVTATISSATTTTLPLFSKVVSFFRKQPTL